MIVAGKCCAIGLAREYQRIRKNTGGAHETAFSIVVLATTALKCRRVGEFLTFNTCDWQLVQRRSFFFLRNYCDDGDKDLLRPTLGISDGFAFDT